MFDISEKLVSEQEEINNVDKIHWKNHSWKQLSLIDDETVINLQRACLGRVHQHPESNEARKQRIGWIVTDKSYRDYDGINGEPTEFEWNIFSGFTTFTTLDVLFNLHSIINNGLIPGGQNSSKRQTVFFLPIDPRDKGHQDPAKIDFNEPPRAQYLHSAWKKHQDAVFWVDIDLAIRKGLTFYQTRSNAIIFQGTLPACCIPKVVRLKTGEVLYEKSYMSPRPPPKISSRHDHNWTRGKVPLGSTVDQQPEGKVVRQSRGEVQYATFSQLTQPTPKPICDRSGQPEDMQDVFVVEGETSRSHEINENGFHEKLCASDRSGQPDERNSSTTHIVKEQHAHEVHREIASFNTDNEFNRKINEEDIDFNIPGLPHSTVNDCIVPAFEN